MCHGEGPSDSAPQSKTRSADAGSNHSPAGATSETSGEQKASAAEDDPMKALQARVEKLEDSLLRARADLQNQQRRAAVERSQAVRFGNAELMRSLLGVLDDFERCLAAGEETGGDDHGVKLIYENLRQALVAQGLETIDALHQPFDPSVHEAMMQRPSDDHPAGTVVEQLAGGYRLHDRVLRPAKVVVATRSKRDG
ncbi:MAG: nucleotide exchange factor GrpE [Phycisphaerae bacterium]